VGAVERGGGGGMEGMEGWSNGEVLFVQSATLDSDIPECDRAYDERYKFSIKTHPHYSNLTVINTGEL
jgi:hypothetical protein